jgi:PPP family 3-phenylpropionic acid transporter
LITLVAAPFWTGVADATRRHRLIMSLGIAMSVSVVLLLQSLTAFAWIFAAIILFNIFLSPVSPLADSATIAMLGENRGMYGRLRLGGTIGWGLFAPIAGALVENYGLKLAFWSFSALMFLNFIVSQKVVHESSSPGASNNGGVRYFLTSRRWIFFLLTAFLGGLGSFSAASYLYPYMAEMGATESTMGLALTLATLTELPIFFFGNLLVKRLTSYRLLMLALVLLGVRALFYALVSSPAAVLVVQVFGGTLFPALWLAGVTYADEHAPAGLKSTAQGLFGAVTFGFGSAIAGFAGGPLLESVGGRGMFLVFGLIILGGLVLIEVVRRILPVDEVPQAV